MRRHVVEWLWRPRFAGPVPADWGDEVARVGRVLARAYGGRLHGRLLPDATVRCLPASDTVAMYWATSPVTATVPKLIRFKLRFGPPALASWWRPLPDADRPLRLGARWWVDPMPLELLPYLVCLRALTEKEVRRYFPGGEDAS